MIYVGIDPDLKESGLATYEDGKYHLEVLSLVNMYQRLASLPADSIVIISAGWLNAKTQFREVKNQFVSDKIASLVGMNHAVGLLIVEFCKDNSIRYVLARPRGKKADAKLFRAATGYMGKKLNQDMIDAGMCIYEYLNKKTP